MQITVKCYATLAHLAPEDGMLSLPDGARVKDVIVRLAIPDGEVKICFINKVLVDEEAVLHDADLLGLFPAVGGG